MRSRRRLAGGKLRVAQRRLGEVRLAQLAVTEVGPVGCGADEPGARSSASRRSAPSRLAASNRARVRFAARRSAPRRNAPLRFASRRSARRRQTPLNGAPRQWIPERSRWPISRSPPMRRARSTSAAATTSGCGAPAGLSRACFGRAAASRTGHAQYSRRWSPRIAITAAWSARESRAIRPSAWIAPTRTPSCLSPRCSTAFVNRSVICPSRVRRSVRTVSRAPSASTMPPSPWIAATRAWLTSVSRLSSVAAIRSGTTSPGNTKYPSRYTANAPSRMAIPMIHGLASGLLSRKESHAPRVPPAGALLPSPRARTRSRSSRVAHREENNAKNAQNKILRRYCVSRAFL